MRIPPQPIDVLHDEHWRAGTLLSWEVDTTGAATAVVIFDNGHNELELGHFPASHFRPPR